VHAIAARHDVHPVQVSAWKKDVAERLPEVFGGKPDSRRGGRQGAGEGNLREDRPAQDGA